MIRPSTHFVGRFSGALAMAATLALAGCAERLLYGDRVELTAPQGETATAETGGIRLTLSPGGWSGAPADLAEVVTPIRVRIENRSGHPLRLRYDQFHLLGKDNAVTAQPPYRIDARGAVVGTVLLPKNYLRPEFIPAPHYRSLDGDTFQPRHPWNYGEYTPGYFRWVSPLPTQDMLEKGMPEGVLESGATLDGFLYFPKPPPRGGRLVTFAADLVAAESGQTLGTIRIPLRTG